MLKIQTYTLGPVLTNSYLVSDDDSGRAVVIDPADSGQMLVEEAQNNGFMIEAVWLTHAHFDHLGGVAELINELGSTPQVALHPNDMPLWHAQGGAPFFGLQIDPGPEPTIELIDKELLYIGRYQFEVRHTPGHTPGHVVFYCLSEDVMFCGDVIFQFSIGRTDLPGGDYNTLIQSIRTKILILPDETRLLPGHGPETSVGVEKLNNPFLI
ncbi:MAG: MBL fold metallo-hydrolase [Anaerolineales bacterium]|nr:MBL fold metallo-hydrolase [Anaerolineales bacterium]